MSSVGLAALKLIKHRLRASLSQEVLNQLMRVCHDAPEFSDLQYDAVIDAYAEQFLTPPEAQVNIAFANKVS